MRHEPRLDYELAALVGRITLTDAKTGWTRGAEILPDFEYIGGGHYGQIVGTRVRVFGNIKSSEGMHTDEYYVLKIYDNDDDFDYALTAYALAIKAGLKTLRTIYFNREKRIILMTPGNADGAVLVSRFPQSEAAKKLSRVRLSKEQFAKIAREVYTEADKASTSDDFILLPGDSFMMQFKFKPPGTLNDVDVFVVDVDSVQDSRFRKKDRWGITPTPITDRAQLRRINMAEAKQTLQFFLYQYIECKEGLAIIEGLFGYAAS